MVVLLGGLLGVLAVVVMVVLVQLLDCQLSWAHVPAKLVTLENFEKKKKSEPAVRG